MQMHLVIDAAHARAFDLASGLRSS